MKLANREDIDNIINLITDRIRWMDDNNYNGWNRDNYLKFYNYDYFLNRLNNNELYVLKIDNKLIGSVCISNNDDGWDDNKKSIYVHNLVTDSNYKDIGKKILEFVEDYALNNNTFTIRLDCHKDNEKLNNYYENLGYKLVGEYLIGDYIGNKREKKIR